MLQISGVVKNNSSTTQVWEETRHYKSYTLCTCTIRSSL